jgi:hypothetical protein
MICIKDTGGKYMKDNKAIESDMTRKLFLATSGGSHRVAGEDSGLTGFNAVLTGK